MNEQVILYEQAIAWVGLALLLVLCLPFAGIQKLVLEVYGWGLRLALLALLFTAPYLWFHPEQLPVEVTDTLNNVPLLKALLPEPGTPFFGIGEGKWTKPWGLGDDHLWVDSVYRNPSVQ